MTTETKEMTDLQKTLLTLPHEVVDAFNAIDDVDVRNGYIAALREQGWTLQSLADVTEITRERVRQIAGNTEPEAEDLPLPSPPRKTQKAKPQYVEPSPETLARLLELQPLAQKVRSNSSQYRSEAEEYTALLNYAHTVEGVTLYRLALRLGVTHGALRFRLARYGYKKPKEGTSKVYSPIKAENRESVTS